jgi:D-3-phosphoglycerate dehydrogenase
MSVSLSHNEVYSLNNAMSYEIIITDLVFSDLNVEREVFDSIDGTITHCPVDSPDEVIENAASADGIITIDADLTDKVFNTLSDLKAVGNMGIGVDNIDIESASKHGVQVFNVPDYCIDEVSTHALTMMLAARRKLLTYDRSVRNQEWNWRVGEPIRRISNDTVGLVSFETIAKELVKKLRGFEVEVVGFDPYIDEEIFADHGVEKVGFDRLLEVADSISIHAPLTEETRGLFDTHAFEQMKDHAVVVNTARGPIIDQEALMSALDDDEIGVAALDVMSTEPPEDSELFDRENVILSPHVAWYSEESKHELRKKTAEMMSTALVGGEPEHILNP